MNVKKIFDYKKRNIKIHKNFDVISKKKCEFNLQFKRHIRKN
jgi:hypothetical protein